MVIVYGDKNMCNCFAIKTSKWTTPCHVLSKKTKIVAHGKFIDFIHPTWMRKIQLKWNCLTTNVRILATIKQLIGN
jgi:hypothetical protein